MNEHDPETMNSFDMEDDPESDKLTTSKRSTQVYPDPIQDKILGIYRSLNLEDNEIMKFVLMVSPIGLIMAFYMFVSPSTSVLIAFSAFVISIVFLGVGFIILCEILQKDIGPR